MVSKSLSNKAIFVFDLTFDEGEEVICNILVTLIATRWHDHVLNERSIQCVKPIPVTGICNRKYRHISAIK